MRLSNNFELAEFVVSPTAKKLGIENKPGKSQRENLKALAVLLLEPLRAKVAEPIIVTSGFRSKELNKAVGGSPKSFHRKGLAADIFVRGMDVQGLYKMCYLHLPHGHIAECILEFNKWVHIALRIPEPYEPKFLIAKTSASGLGVRYEKFIPTIGL